MMTSTRVDAFRLEIEQAGLTPPAAIIADGKLHRFASNGDRADDAGWYTYFPDEPQAGVFGCWRTGLKQTWSGKADSTLTPAERERQRTRFDDARRQREQDERLRHANAVERAQRLWERAQPAPATHPYLQRKQVQAHGLRIQCGDLVIAGQSVNGALIVPLHDAGGALCSLEFITADGTKLYLPGGRKHGGSYLIGTVGDMLHIVEGYATGASVHEATGCAVAVAFDAGNLRPVAEGYRARYPNLKLMICGDHDANGTGQTKAREAADAINGVVALPEEQGQDFNDVHVQRGLDAVRENVSAANQREEATTMESGDILDEVYTFLGRFVAYPSDHARVAHCLWAAHTHLMDKWESTPRLAFLSPEPGSGKTRALELTETLVPRPVEAINASPAYMFRKISDPEGMPTILYDEIDTIFGPRAKEHEELRGVINAGHRRGASAGRCVIRGKTVETEELPAFCAIAIAGLGNLPDTILSRSIIARMRRRKPTEHVEPYRRRVHAKEGNQLRDRLAAWARQISPRLDTNPLMPDGIEDRNADVWESLLSVADAAGGDWPERARVAAVALVAANRGNQLSLGVRLLTDLYSFFLKQSGDAWTEDILTALHNLEEAPWGDLKGKPLDSRKLANLLLPYGVKSDQVKIGGVNHRGYKRADLQDAWARYLPVKEEEGRNLDPSPQISATSATHATDSLFTEVEL